MPTQNLAAILDSGNHTTSTGMMKFHDFFQWTYLDLPFQDLDLDLNVFFQDTFGYLPLI